MKCSLNFTVMGPPVPKARPRFNKQTRTIFTPKATKVYEKLIGIHGWAAVQNAPLEKAKFWPVKIAQVYVDYWIYSEKKATDPRAPDQDNIEKAILDGLEGVLYKNDRQALGRCQGYEFEDPNPRVEIRVEIK